MSKGNSLLGGMLKEEWRMQSSIFGNTRFAFLPVLIFIFSFILSLSIMFFSMNYPTNTIFLFIHILLFLFGASIGGFGVIGKEIMNRRFGQASLLTYSSRTLPISERKIFSIFIIKDLIYYFLLWIIPITLGLILALPVIGMSLANAPILFISLLISFLLGMSFVFLLSMLYANLGKYFIWAILILIILAIIIFGKGFSFLPSWQFYYYHDIAQLILSVVLILLMSGLSIIFVKFDFPSKKKVYKNTFIKISNYFSFSKKNRYLWAKDFIDMKRSDGGFGKIFFSFLVPILLVLIIAPILSSQIHVETYILFAILLGVVSTATYNQLTQYDLFNQYLFLPVKVSSVIKSKILGYSIINIILIIVLFVLGFVYKSPILIIPALILYILTSYFALAVTIYNTGLTPSIMLMDSKLLLKYVIIMIPMIVILIIMYAFGPITFILGSTIFLLASVSILIKSLKKWDELPQQVF